MDAAKNKALFRAKLNAQKKEKRIDSPLVRYNESNEPVCRVCNVVLKSEALWDAHQASRKHHEAIDKFKANAAGHTNTKSVKSEPRKESTRAKYEETVDLHDKKIETFLPSKPQTSSVLPSDFFDNQVLKKQKTGIESNKPMKADYSEHASDSGYDGLTNSYSADEADRVTHINGVSAQQAGDSRQGTPVFTVSGTKQVTGTLPEGFFDNKEADSLARGIKPVKPNVKDEYKEFEKLIQEDLQEVDDRLEEEEIDAAEMIEEAETVEQRAYREKVEMLRKKKMELMASRSVNRRKDFGIPTPSKDSSAEESSSDDDDGDDNFTVDWRAQHL